MARKKSKQSEAPEPEAVEPPQEGTKGVIWGQQVKKPKSAGWVEQLDWHDASPASFDEFLTGAEEGGGAIGAFWSGNVARPLPAYMKKSTFVIGEAI